MLSAILTPLTHALLRRTVRRWFETDDSVAETRRKIDGMIGVTDPMPRGWQATPAGFAGGGALYRVEPRGKTWPVGCVYFHGGGYIVGGLKTHAAYCARLARQLGRAVLFADYRLAPEAAFPAAYEDACAAYAQAAQAAQDLVIAGDSAGGGLALAVAQYAAQTLGKPAAKLILFSPWLDLSLSGGSITANEATDSMLSAKALGRMRDAYLAGADNRDPRASPILGELGGLPPTLIFVSNSEVLRADGRRLKTEMEWKRGTVALLEYNNMPHIFPLLATLPASRQAMREVAAFLKT